LLECCGFISSRFASACKAFTTDVTVVTLTVLDAKLGEVHRRSKY